MLVHACVHAYMRVVWCGVVWCGVSKLLWISDGIYWIFIYIKIGKFLVLKHMLIIGLCAFQKERVKKPVKRTKNINNAYLLCMINTTKRR